MPSIVLGTREINIAGPLTWLWESYILENHIGKIKITKQQKYYKRDMSKMYENPDFLEESLKASQRRWHLSWVLKDKEKFARWRTEGRSFQAVQRVGYRVPTQTPISWLSSALICPHCQGKKCSVLGNDCDSTVPGHWRTYVRKIHTISGNREILNHFYSPHTKILHLLLLT